LILRKAVVRVVWQVAVCLHHWQTPCAVSSIQILPQWLQCPVIVVTIAYPLSGQAFGFRLYLYSVVKVLLLYNNSVAQKHFKLYLKT
jgi:hypothetical protein